MKLTLYMLIISLSFCTSVDRSEKAFVTRVLDGDTIEVLLDGSKKKVRLQHIDAPERGMAFSKRSKQLLASLCGSDSVVLTSVTEMDQYGRIIAEVILDDGRVANQVMVDSGLAWHYKYYSDQQVYDSLESAARINKRGLWRDNNPEAPWDYRRRKRKQYSR